MIFITFNSAISCITVYLTYYRVKKLCGIRLAVLGYIFCVISVCMLPWTSIPYSDPLTVFVPVTILALFIMIQPCNKDDQTTENDKAWGGWIWSIIFFLGIIGYHIKPQAVIVLIAIVIVSVTSNKRKPIKQLFIVLAFAYWVSLRERAFISSHIMNLIKGFLSTRKRRFPIIIG